MKIRVCIAVLSAFLLLSGAISADGKPFHFPDGSSEYKSPNGVLRMAMPSLSGSEMFVVEGFDPKDPTNDVVVIDRDDWMLAVIYTKIRREYRKDFGVIEEKILPLERSVAERYGPKAYQVSKGVWGQTEVAESLNYMPAFDLERDIGNLRELGPSYGGSNEHNQRRVDVWFVRDGYLVQIIAVANSQSGVSAERVMPKARDVAHRAFDALKMTPLKITD